MRYLNHKPPTDTLRICCLPVNDTAQGLLNAGAMHILPDQWACLQRPRNAMPPKASKPISFIFPASSSPSKVGALLSL